MNLGEDNIEIPLHIIDLDIYLYSFFISIKSIISSLSGEKFFIRRKY